MGDPWSPERVVDVALARALVESQFRDLVPARVDLLGVGWDNTAFLVNGAWVFRFPRRSIAVPLLERECKLLPAIAPTVPLPIPVPVYVGAPSSAFPWPFAGYRRLEGQTACSASFSDEARLDLAEPLARFLRALHAFPASEASRLGATGDELGRVDLEARIPKARACLGELEELALLDRDTARSLERVLERIEGTAVPSDETLVHGDLYARHVLVDARGRAAGVIDWGDLHLGHRAVDLGVAHIFLPARARGAFRRAYGPIDDATWELARVRALYHCANVTRYAHRVGDVDLLREGRSALSWLSAD
jgi:aminoglycoside phosphotransferase (APT) family kinase protein